MRKSILVLALLILLPATAAAQEQTVSVRQSVNYFINYFNESVVQLIKIQDYLKKNNPDYRVSLFYFDLTNRAQKAIGLAFNMRDLYFLYGKTKYCFTKDEKRYIYDRADNIVGMLQKIQESKYMIEPETLFPDKNNHVRENYDEFNERLVKLREFVKTSLTVLN